MYLAVCGLATRMWDEGGWGAAFKQIDSLRVQAGEEKMGAGEGGEGKRSVGRERVRWELQQLQAQLAFQ